MKQKIFRYAFLAAVVCSLSLTADAQKRKTSKRTATKKSTTKKSTKQQDQVVAPVPATPMITYNYDSLPVKPPVTSFENDNIVERLLIAAGGFDVQHPRRVQ